MTAKQKAARAKFKRIVKEASKLRKKNPKLTQAQAVKQAWAISYSKERKGQKLGDYKLKDVVYKDKRGISTSARGKYKVIRSKDGTFANFSKIGAVKKSKVKAKKGKSGEMHTDTKSHNVNIRIVSGNKIPSQYVTLSGYDYGKEIIVAGVSKLSTLKNLVPEVKLRVNRGKKSYTDVINSAEIASGIFKKFINKNKIETQEFFAVAYLSTANKVLGIYVHSMGSINSASVDVRLVMAGALQLGAVGMILCHNHPSGNLQPSEADKIMTKKLIDAAKFHDIRILDHVIISKDGFFSFAEQGLI